MQLCVCVFVFVHARHLNITVIYFTQRFDAFWEFFFTLCLKSH